jgi:hypothetical protein
LLIDEVTETVADHCHDRIDDRLLHAATAVTPWSWR